MDSVKKGEKVRLERRVQVKNEYGIHVRPSTRFVELAQAFKSTIKVKLVSLEGEAVEDSEELDGKSVFQLLQLGATKGAELVLYSEGEDAQEALDSLGALVENKFEE
ncbi:MAG: HPr family phosphocarrier protein [Simkania sp.]|nr:HPr family phosphocarrier protein [Simkania sp.]